MRRSPILSLLALAGLHAPAVPGDTASVMEIKNHAPLLPSYHFFPELRTGGGYYAPPYNQRKARKLARQRGVHPANPKRR